MLPFNTNINKTIYINPNFKGQLLTPGICASLKSTPIIPSNAHINPLFLEAKKYGNTIHMNPAFLQKFQQQREKNIINYMPENEWTNSVSHQQPTNSVVPEILFKKSLEDESRKIICKSKNRLIREPLKRNNDQSLSSAKPSSLQPLLVISKRKLVRKAPFVTEKLNSSEKNCFDNSKTRITKYKLDNRLITKKPLLPPTPRIRRTSYVGRYALKRTALDETTNTKKRSISISKNKKLKFLNINGLLYKSTRNSLKLKDITPVRMVKSFKKNASSEKLYSNANQGRIIYVRGDKYVMDANKFKLTRVTSCDRTSNYITSSNSFKPSPCKRIDIGGYTYVSLNSAKNVLIRTTNHLSRAYVHNAKQKSLQMLTKRLVKTNIPCPIFQHIGKCAAFERGKCSKVHNKLQIAICSKFLRGECLNANCLLSHNVSLSKMPACKFFLQGVCVRNDCPYLHKKLSSSAELCTDFLRGFCQMADKCNKRHEFVCPEIERNNICTTANCVYCNAKRRKESQLNIKSETLKSKKSTTLSKGPPSNSAEVVENQSCQRYFIKSCNKTMETIETHGQFENETAKNIDDTEYLEETCENSNKTRPKLGSLPAYIPL